MAVGGRPADVLVALLVAPLLVLLGLLLQSNLRGGGHWTADPQRRWNVLGLALGLLCVALLLCCYVAHRLGACLWDARRRRQHLAQVEVLVPRELPAAMTAETRGGSQVQLVVRATDPPPSYESVAGGGGGGGGGVCDAPPPYCAVVVYGQEAVSAAPAPAARSSPRLLKSPT